MVTPSMRKTVGALLGLTLAAASPVALAISDVLETPARETSLADKSLLTDVTKAGDRLVAAGERGLIIYSDNQGKSWKQATVPVSTTLTSVYFPTPQEGWAVGHGAVILHSEDAGATWKKQIDGAKAADFVIAGIKKQIAEMQEKVEAAPDDKKDDLSWTLDGMKFALEDAEADKKTGPWKPLLDVWFANATKGFAVGSYGFIFRTDDGGQTWQDWSGHLPNPDRYHLNGIARLTGGTLAIAGEAGVIFISNDKGDTWEKKESPYAGSLFGVMGTGDVNEMIVFGLRGHVLMSTDLGNSWETVPTKSGNTINSGAVTKDGRITLVGNGGAVLFSDNGGKSYRSYFRKDRQGIMAVEPISDSELVLFGEGGVKHTDISGKNRQ